MKNAQKGFTLVEIAIVLVIIGLLLGGILKGQEMIVQAKIKNAMADFSGISAAYHGYQDRYRAIPGDDSNAATRWAANATTGATAAGVSATAGDGVLQGKYNVTTGDTVESRLWWDHLRRAGFVAGSGLAQPTNAFTGMIGVQTGDGNATIATVLGGFGALIVCSANIPDKVAIAIDTSMDDGVLLNGTVRSRLQTLPNEDVTGSVSAPYAETGTNIYTVCRQI
jgi:prepilin-type N-terminal cleavage/methylation domain-containing protein